MITFVENVDLTGKTILPFVTYAVSGLGITVDDYTRLCPQSTIGEALAVRGEEARNAQADVQEFTVRLLAQRVSHQVICNLSHIRVISS